MTVCAAPRHGEDQAETEAHSQLCRPCRLGLSRDLRRLPALHAGLEHIPATRGGDGTGLPFSEPAADCRSQIRHDLTYWAREVLDDPAGRRCDPPSSTRWNADEIPVLSGWLHGHMSWIPFRDWAPDMAGAIGADRSRAAALLDPWLSKRIDLPGPDGACLECDGGRMVVTVYVWAEDSRKSFIGCTECDVRWEFGGAWLPFLKALKRRRDAA